MPHLLLDEERVVAVLDQMGHVGMAQAMQPEPGRQTHAVAVVREPGYLFGVQSPQPRTPGLRSDGHITYLPAALTAAGNSSR